MLAGCAGARKRSFLACDEGRLAKDFDTRSQLRKAAMSSMNNIAEEFSRFHRNDSIKFYGIAQSSAAKVPSMCYILEDMEYVSPERIDTIRKKAAENTGSNISIY
jgi:four helix bundle protein